MNIFGIVVDPDVVAGIVLLLSSGIASFVTQIIKNALHLAGTAAIILTGVVGVGCTAIYFVLLHPPFILGTFLVYSIVIFGLATGYYKLGVTNTKLKLSEFPVAGWVVIALAAVALIVCLFAMKG